MTLSDVIADIRATLVEEVIEPQDLRITRVVVGRGQLQELHVSLDVPETQLPIARRVILESSPSYEGVETFVMRLAGAEVRFPRQPAEREGGPIPARPGSGPKRELDLSNLYKPQHDVDAVGDEVRVAVAEHAVR